MYRETQGDKMAQRGRPKAKDKLVTWGWTVREQTINTLQELAEQEHARSASEIVRCALEFTCALKPLAERHKCTVPQLLASIARMMAKQA